MTVNLLDRPPPIDDDLTRREFIVGGLSLAALLAACGGNDEDSAGGRAKGAEGPWTFTDDRGRTITLDRRPERVVAYIGAASALWDFGLRSIVGVYGPQRLPDGRPDSRVGSLDLATVQSVGEEYGQFNVEKLAALRPDLIVEVMYKGAFFYVAKEVVAKVEQIAPVAGLELQGVDVLAVLGRVAQLAKALGADLDSSETARARGRFEAASEALRRAAADKPGLKVLAASGTPEKLYVVRPSSAGDLSYFTKLGLDVVVPEGGEFFEELSWEQADKYPADVILVDNRAQALRPDQLDDKPTWAALPAVRAGQLGPYYAETRLSYQQNAAILEELAALVRRSRADVA